MIQTNKEWKTRKPLPGWPFGFPDWFHHHGTKMRLESFQAEEKSVVIANHAATLRISPYKEGGYAGWNLEYSIRQSMTAALQGNVLMSHDQLAAAFKLKEVEIDSASRWLINRFGGDYAYQAKCIRYQDFLNIPCPGTGHDGDPNISIDLDESMRSAVATLLEIHI